MFSIYTKCWTVPIIVWFISYRCECFCVAVFNHTIYYPGISQQKFSKIKPSFIL